MIVTFIGHAKLNYDMKVAKKLLKVMEDKIEGENVTFYIGMNGNFDSLALQCCLEYKDKYKNAKLVFVTPYLDEAYLKARGLAIKEFDEVIYPDLENVPKRYAIVARNKYMIDCADVVITFASYAFGNAHRYYHYALRKFKDAVNLDDMYIEI